MMKKQRVVEIAGESFFTDDLAIYINRNAESFGSSYHSHDFYEIALVAEGKGYHHVGNQTMPVTKGDLFVLPVGVSHVFRPSDAKDHGFIVYNCLFQEQLLTSLTAYPFVTAKFLLSIDRLRQPNWFKVFDHNSEFDSIFKQLYFEYNRKDDSYRAMMLFTLLIQLMIRLDRPQSIIQNNGSKHPSLDEGLSYITRNLAEPLTLHALAKRMGMSARHVQRLMVEYTGQSFTSYLQHARMKSASQLLHTTNMKLSLIAEQVGYADLGSFSRTFKRIVGCTPGQYRKRNCNRDSS